MNEARGRNNEFILLFHTDAAQTIGKVDVNVIDLGVDYLTIVGHKVGHIYYHFTYLHISRQQAFTQYFGYII